MGFRVRQSALRLGCGAIPAGVFRLRTSVPRALGAAGRVRGVDLRSGGAHAGMGGMDDARFAGVAGFFHG